MTRYVYATTLIFALAVACAPPDSSESDEAWIAFRESARRSSPEGEYFLVEWDLGLSESLLHDYYQSTVAGGGQGVVEAELTVNLNGSSDDIWSRQDALDLKYCVSTGFGSNYARAVDEMENATSSWMRIANVRFTHVTSADSTCTTSNSSVDFPVTPWAMGGACSFGPSGGGCVAGTLVMDFNDFDTNPAYSTLSPNLTTTGVFRHELGHILGFRHEQVRPEAWAAGCPTENSSWRALTPYDMASVMHYPWCNGVTASDMMLTREDQVGAVLEYRLSAAIVAGL